MDLGAVFLILEHMSYNTCDRKPLLSLVIVREPWPIRCCFPMGERSFPSVFCGGGRGVWEESQGQ